MAVYSPETAREQGLLLPYHSKQHGHRTILEHFLLGKINPSPSCSPLILASQLLCNYESVTKQPEVYSGYSSDLLLRILLIYRTSVVSRGVVNRLLLGNCIIAEGWCTLYTKGMCLKDMRRRRKMILSTGTTLHAEVTCSPVLSTEL